MKLPIIAISFLLVATSFQTQAQDGPPSLSLVEAAKIAESSLKDMNLPQDYFIRSVMLSSSKDDPNTQIYEARFEPPARRMVRRTDTAAEEAEPEIIKYKVIIVSLDGKASLEEREFTPTRTIQRRTVSKEGSSTN